MNPLTTELQNKPASYNIAALMEEQAATRPHQRAVVFPHGRDAFGNVAWTHLTFAHLNAATDAFARGLVAHGIGRGDRVSLLMKPSLHFIPLVFAVFKLGAIPVMIDPGMGREGFLRCIAESRPKALLGEPIAVLLSRLFPRAFRTVQLRVTAGTAPGLGLGIPVATLGRSGEGPFPTAICAREDEAAILYTSGSTGPAKGVTYTHGIFHAQTRAIQAMYGIEPGEIDLACFPLFGLFTMAMGCTVVIPEMDPTKPAKADPFKLIEAIETQGCTSAFGSPAIWKNLARLAQQRPVRLPTLRRILMAGAPIPVWMHEIFHQDIFEGRAELHTPYGATESLPVASIASREVLGETAAKTREGSGTCVGRPASGITLRIIRITDEAIPEWSDDLLLPDGEIGEIVVDGEVVTHEYKDAPDHTAKAKIRKDGRILHRIGDVGWLDGEGRLWFCGRKSHRVDGTGGQRWFSEPVEGIFNEHPAVMRSALVGVAGEPGLVVELEKGIQIEPEQLRAELLALGAKFPQTQAISRVWTHPAFPVDVRHNAKIDRTALSAWTAQNRPIAAGSLGEHA